ncbi:MAG: DUF2577 domain-containing protein [Oscillospiraceae bacterium]|jgi:hypothetical protein|nr:DUF2577 domain-containing protein [Oscillospiraceae bacterium]
MELIDTLMKISEKNLGNAGLTDLTIGTVTSTDPLEITLVGTMLVLPRAVLLLTESVVEKKLTVDPHTHDINVLGHNHTTGGLGHSHTAPGGVTSTDLTSEYPSSTDLDETYTTLETTVEMQVTENGGDLPTETGTVTLNRALAVGDKVIMLRVMGGQQFLVLSRVF